MLGNVRYPIAISGKANAGKNTVASMFVDVFGLDSSTAIIVALADPMKHIAEVMFPLCDRECLYGESKRRAETISSDYIDGYSKELTYRQFLLDLGKFGRAYNPDIWLKCLVEKAIYSDHIAYIVSDVRMRNEFEFLQKHQFYTVRVIRDTCTMINDVSETEQDSIRNSDFDFVINNSSTLYSLYAQVKAAADYMKALSPKGAK